MLQKITSGKIKNSFGTKNAFFFLSRASTHRSFTLNLRFLYELSLYEHKFRLCKVRFSRFVFTKVHIFVQQNA